MPTILITGFGPFPSAPYNPTIKLVETLARIERPALAGFRIVGHVFETSYAAVDRDLPALLDTHKPDALLMFGLAAGTKYIRIETRAQNKLTVFPDATGVVRHDSVIAASAPRARPMPAPQRKLLSAARAAGAPAKLSRDAGRYLCNYLCWRATETGAPKLAAFVHVPLENDTWTANRLRRAGTRVLLALAAALEKPATGVNRT